MRLLISPGYRDYYKFCITIYYYILQYILVHFFRGKYSIFLCRMQRLRFEVNVCVFFAISLT